LGSDWTKLYDDRGKTGAKQVAVDPDGNPWIIGYRNRIFKTDVSRGSWYKWVPVRGRAAQIAIGAEGSIFVLGLQTVKNGKDHPIFYYDKSMFKWVRHPGQGVKIAVSPKGYPWIVTAKRRVWRWGGESQKWVKMPGRPEEIAIGGDGSVFATDVKGRIWKWQEFTYRWFKLNGKAVKISVGPMGRPYIIKASGAVYWPENACPPPTNTPQWEKIPSKQADEKTKLCHDFKVQKGLARDISIGADGSLFVVGVDRQEYGFGVWEWKGADWIQMEGVSGVRIAVAADG
jgi:hypothetical protein